MRNRGEQQWAGMPQLIPRHVFAERYFHYTPGQHVVFGGPTRRGKTQLAFDLLEYCATPDCPAYVAVSKPSDEVTSYYAERNHWRIVRDWPPNKRVRDYFADKPSGYVIWPQFGDMYNDVQNCSEITARLLADRYAAGAKPKDKREKGILVIDDTMTKSKLMGLDGEMVTILAMAGAMGLGEWVFVQKATDSGQTVNWSYSQSEHVFLFSDPDGRSRDRYGEIGGVDPVYVDEVLQALQPKQALYICRSGPVLAVIDADSRHGKIGQS
jgi:hypothetical protein